VRLLWSVGSVGSSEICEQIADELIGYVADNRYVPPEPVRQTPSCLNRQNAVLGRGTYVPNIHVRCQLQARVT
jgi:hypothetical protein